MVGAYNQQMEGLRRSFKESNEGRSVFFFPGNIYIYIYTLAFSDILSFIHGDEWERIWQMQLLPHVILPFVFFGGRIQCDGALMFLF